MGTQNANNLISVSSDGRMCSWSLDMLSSPQDTQDLQQKQNKAVAATCMTFPVGEVNNFIVGSEEGAVYSGKINRFILVHDMNLYDFMFLL